VSQPAPLISIVIVHFKVPDFLQRTLRSLRQAELYDQTEVIVVDNASEDNSREYITGEFPEISWIGLKSNIGFGKACNVGAQSASGTYLLLLNPDTMVSENSLSECVVFFKEHPETGIVGPKILNPDGTLQVSCRRSFPTPAVAFYHMTGLHRLFPNSKHFGQYNLSYLDPDIAAQVDAVSGSFMFMTLALYREIGGFDESFFMYGEDLDMCYRVKAKGRPVWYSPKTQIIHFKGRSSAKTSLRSRAAFYEAMLIFSRKYRHLHKSFFPGWLIAAAIISRAAVNIIATFFKSFTATLIDFLLINITLAGIISLRFSVVHEHSPYFGENTWVLVCMHCLFTLCFLGIFTYRGVYYKERYSVINALVSGTLASIIFMCFLYFVKSMAFSRIAFIISAATVTLLLIAWRETIPKLVSRFKRIMYTTGKAIVLGNDAVSSILIKNIEADNSTKICGILWPADNNVPGEFMGYPVLGTMDSVTTVLEREQADLLLIATIQPWYSYVIEALASSKIRNLTIRWVPHELFAIKTEQLPTVIPLRDFTV